MREAVILGIVILCLGVTVIGFSVPLLFGKIPPNHWYGVRLKKALSNEQIWYKANKYSAKDFFVVGLLQVLVGLVLLISRASLSEFTAAWLTLTVVVVPVSIATVRAVVYVRKL